MIILVQSVKPSTVMRQLPQIQGGGIRERGGEGAWDQRKMFTIMMAGRADCQRKMSLRIDERKMVPLNGREGREELKKSQDCCLEVLKSVNSTPGPAPGTRLEMKDKKGTTGIWRAKGF